MLTSVGCTDLATAAGHRRTRPVGNGNGIKAFGGTFSLVVNP